jgi:hypothetical protein
VTAQGLAQSSAAKHDRSAVVAAAIGGIATIVAALVGGLFGYRKAQGASDNIESFGPPSVHVTSAWWYDRNQLGRYVIKGESKNLRPGQLIWTYNQPIHADGSKGPLYPDPGPCPVGPDGGWTCDAGFAGEAKSRGQRFMLWAMVVDERQGYAAIKTKLRLGNPGNSYTSPDDVPHVDGTQTQDFYSMTRSD